jgi:hypothetical protein
MENIVKLPRVEFLRLKLAENAGKFPPVLAIVAEQFAEAACRRPPFIIEDHRLYLWDTMYRYAETLYRHDDGFAYFLSAGAFRICELLELEASFSAFVRERGTAEAQALICTMPRFFELRKQANRIWRQRQRTFQAEPGEERRHIEEIWRAMPGKWGGAGVHVRSYSPYLLGFEVLAGSDPAAKRTHRQLADLQGLLFVLAQELNKSGTMPQAFFNRVKRSFEIHGGVGVTFPYRPEEQ